MLEKERIYVTEANKYQVSSKTEDGVIFSVQIEFVRWISSHLIIGYVNGFHSFEFPPAKK